MAVYDEGGVEQARYVHGPGIDGPLLQLRDRDVYAYHGDGLGSVTRITDAEGTAVRTYGYDTSSRITSESGRTGPPSSHALNLVAGTRRPPSLRWLYGAA